MCLIPIKIPFIVSVFLPVHVTLLTLALLFSEGIVTQKKKNQTLLIENSALGMKKHSNASCSLRRKSPGVFFEYISATPYLAPAPIYTHLPFQIAI